MRINRSWRSSATVLAVACAAVPSVQRQASAQSPRSAPASIDAEAKTVADSMWWAILTTCPVHIQGQAKTATFYDSQKGILHEFLDTWTRLFPEPRADADKLNGVEFRGSAVLGFSAYRTMERNLPLGGGKRRWSEFSTGSKNPSEVRTKDDLQDRWNNTKYIWMSVGMEKRNGQWSFESYPWGLSMRGDFHRGSLTKATDRKSCTAFTSSDPFAADDALARKQEEERLAQERRLQEEKWARVSLENDLKVSRDLGNALLCKGTRVRDSLIFDNSSSLPAIPNSISVKIVGASDKGGVLGEWLRVRLLESGRFYGLGDRYYFVPVGSVRDSCGPPNTPGLVSGSALAEGVRATGSLERWPEWRKQAEEKMSRELNAAALTAQEFEEKLTDTVRKRGPEAGEDQFEYGAAIQWASSIVLLCSSISPSEYAASLDSDDLAQLSRYQQGKYAACLQRTGWRASPNSRFAYSIDCSGLDQRWRSEQRNWFRPKLHVNVSLYPFPGNPYDKSYIILSADIKNDADATAVASEPQAPSSLAHPTSIRDTQQLVKICRNAEVFAAPPRGAAAQGSGRLIGTAERGDEGVILQKNDHASKVEFEIPGRKVIGWLPNSAFCTGQ